MQFIEPGHCSDGDIRLVNGTIEQEGRAEVCFNGVWSTICDDSWNTIDGFVFCHSLGYDGPSMLTCYFYATLCNMLQSVYCT